MAFTVRLEFGLARHYRVSSANHIRLAGPAACVYLSVYLAYYLISAFEISLFAIHGLLEDLLSGAWPGSPRKYWDTLDLAGLSFEREQTGVDEALGCYRSPLLYYTKLHSESSKHIST